MALSQQVQLSTQVKGYYTGSKASIEALASVPEGSIAYATDTDEFGTYDGATWTWGTLGSGGFTQEQIEDFVGAMVSSNTETGIDVTYDDATGKLNFDAQTAGDARYAPIAKGVTNGDTHDHNGGDGNQIAYSSLSGTPTVLDTEAVQDIVGAMFSGNTETGISATYEDSDGTIDLDAQTLGDARYQQKFLGASTVTMDTADQTYTFNSLSGFAVINLDLSGLTADRTLSLKPPASGVMTGSFVFIIVTAGHATYKCNIAPFAGSTIHSSGSNWDKQLQTDKQAVIVYPTSSTNFEMVAIWLQNKDTDALYAPIAKGVTNGDSHNHVGGDGAALVYSDVYMGHGGATTVGASTVGSLAFAYVGFIPSGANTPMPKAGTLKNLRVRILTNQPASGSLVFDVMVNNVASAITITLAAGTGAGTTISDTTHTVSIAAGDLVYVRVTNNATGASAQVANFNLELEQNTA